MPNLGSILKDEISRLSRKEQKQGLASLQKASTSHRREISQLKREVATLRRELARLQKGRSAPRVTEAGGETGSTPRFQVRGLKSLRSRLDLGAGDFGKLLGVSGQTIYNWESEKATPRRSQVLALAAIRGIGKKEALARLSGSSNARQ